MKISRVSQINGALLFRADRHVADRGFFARVFDADVARANGIDPASFTRDSLSSSDRGVVRGLRLRPGRGEAKLVRGLPMPWPLLATQISKRDRLAPSCADSLALLA